MDDKGRGFDSRHLHHENGLARGGGSVKPCTPPAFCFEAGQGFSVLPGSLH